jgi:hypothetical protein
MRVLALGAVLLLAACPSPSSDCEPLWGATDAAPELDIGMLGPGGTFVEVSDEDLVDLEIPPQGGVVLFVGARVRNLCGKRAELRADLRFPDGGQVLAYEVRSVSFIVDGGQGLLTDLSDPANVANVPVCPNITTRDVENQEWLLEVSVKDSRDAKATATRRVRPQCRQTNPADRALCSCDCEANYVFGKCAPDAGG